MATIKEQLCCGMDCDNNDGDDNDANNVQHCFHADVDEHSFELACKYWSKKFSRNDYDRLFGIDAFIMPNFYVVKRHT